MNVILHGTGQSQKIRDDGLADNGRILRLGVLISESNRRFEDVTFDRSGGVLRTVDVEFVIGVLFDINLQRVARLVINHARNRIVRIFGNHIFVDTYSREDQSTKPGEVSGLFACFHSRSCNSSGKANSTSQRSFKGQIYGRRVAVTGQSLDNLGRALHGVGGRVEGQFGGGEGVGDGEGVVRSGQKVCNLFRLVGRAGLSHLGRSDRQSAVAFRDFDGQGVDGLVVLHARDGGSGLDFLHSIGVGAFLVEGQLVVLPEEGLRDGVLVFRAGDLDRGHVRNLAGERSSIRIRRSTGDLQLEFLASGRDVGGVGVEGLLEFAGEGELGRSGVTLRDGQGAGFVGDLIVVLVRVADRRDGLMIADSVITCVRTGDGVGQFLLGFLAVDHTRHCCIKSRVFFCGLFALIVCLYLCFCIVDREFCCCSG